jgi:LacI family transcriptional regulator
MTRHLIGLGHRRFGVIAQSTHNNDRAKARVDGVRDALAERSLAIHPAHLMEGRWSIREGRELFRRMLEHEPWPTAVICGNAFLAVGAMLESQAMAIAVPARMSIVGYDDIEIMSELPIPITTVRGPSGEIGRRAAACLLARIEGLPDDTVYECEAEIVVRASSGPASAYGQAL